MAGSVFDSRQARRLFPLCTAAAIAGSFVGRCRPGRSPGRRDGIAGRPRGRAAGRASGRCIVGVSRIDDRPGAARRARPVDRRRPAGRLRRGRPLAADAPRRDRLRPAGDPHVLGDVPVPAGRLRDVPVRGRPGDGARPAVGGRDGHLVPRLDRARQPGLRPLRRGRARRSSCRSSTSPASASGSSPSRSRPRRSSGSPSRSPSAASRTPPGARSTTSSRAERRAQVLAFNDGVPGQIGTILSGLLLLASGTLLARDQVFWLGAGTALVCTVVVVGIRRRYAASVVRTLRARASASRSSRAGPGSPC